MVPFPPPSSDAVLLGLFVRPLRYCTHRRHPTGLTPFQSFFLVDNRRSALFIACFALRLLIIHLSLWSLHLRFSYSVISPKKRRKNRHISFRLLSYRYPHFASFHLSSTFFLRPAHFDFLTAYVAH